MELTDLQRLAIERRSPRILVTAPAGSGKTEVLSQRVAALIREGVSPNQILALTFTRKAAEEMVQRIASHFEDPDEMAGLWATTFHGLGWKLLQRDPSWANRIDGVSLWDEADRLEAVIRVALEAGVKVPPKRPNVERLLVDDRVFHGYERLKTRVNAVDFGDLEELLVSAATSGRLDGYWQHVLVDEYQDTSPAQARVVEAQGKSGASLFVVGDPRQSIYRFRGAAPEVMQGLLGDERWEAIHLVDNFRSDPLIVRMANRVAARMGLGLPDMSPRRPHQVASTGMMTEPGDSGGNEIVAYLRDASGTCAVLARRWDDLLPFAETFEANGIPFRWVRRADDPFSKPGGRLLLNLLRLSANLNDDWLAEQCHRALGADDKEVATTRIEAFISSRPYAMNCRDLDMFIKAGNPSSRAHAHILALGYAASTRFSLDDDELNDAIAVVTRWDAARPGLSTEQFLADWASDPGSMPFEGEAAEAAPGMIDLTTVHSAKGLEWDTVVVANVVANGFPLRFEAEGEELEEARRLFYVAVTRAKNRLIVETPRQRTNRAGRVVESEPSPFVQEMLS